MDAILSANSSKRRSSKIRVNELVTNGWLDIPGKRTEICCQTAEPRPSRSEKQPKCRQMKDPNSANEYKQIKEMTEWNFA